MKAVSPSAYDQVFEGGEAKVPRYLLRPADGEVRPAPAVEFLVFGDTEPGADDAIWSAWDRACEMGLGPDRHPFRIGAAVALGWDETPLRPARVQPGFAPVPLQWPLDGPEGACRVAFPAPLRLIHRASSSPGPRPPTWLSPP